MTNNSGTSSNSLKNNNIYPSHNGGGRKYTTFFKPFSRLLNSLARVISPVARASVTSDPLPCPPSASTPSRQSSRKDKANYRKFLYRNYDEDFALGETLQGVVAGFLKTQSKHLRFVLVDFPDGRHTRVHVRSFDISGYGRMNPSNLRRGDTLTLRKTGYLSDRRITRWVVESCALRGLMRSQRNPETPIPSPKI